VRPYGVVAAFADGITTDRAAVEAAMTSPWANGEFDGRLT
jgi:hypothetical protein